MSPSSDHPDGAPEEIPDDKGDHVNYGGTDDAYSAMEDKARGDQADTANRVDRRDMDGLADPHLESERPRESFSDPSDDAA